MGTAADLFRLNKMTLLQFLFLCLLSWDNPYDQSNVNLR